MGLVLAACPTAKNGVAVTRDCQASAILDHLVAVSRSWARRLVVKVCVPYRVTTWLWCDLPFIEYLVVELDYGKMPATDLSSFDIAL